MTKTNNDQINKHTKAVIPFIPEADFYFSKGVDAFYKRKFDLALKWMKKAAEADPNEALYPAQMSIVHTEMGAYHLANQILTTLLENHSEDYPDCYYLIANNCAHLGLLKDAQKYASIYLDKQPDGDFKSEAEQLLTLLELSLADYDDEIDILQEDELMIYQETAFYHLQRKEWESACAILTEMIGRFPSHIIAQHQYHYALFFTGERKKAIELEEAIFRQQLDSTQSMTNLIVFYYEEGKIDQMEIILKQLENIYPIHFDQSLRAATTFAHVNYFDQAYQRFNLLPKAKLKANLDYFRYYAKTIHALKSEYQAEKIWAEGCKLHPDLASESVPWLD